MLPAPERLTLGDWTLRVFVALLLGTLFLAFWTLRDVFLLTFLAIILATVLQVPVRRLGQLGLSRGLSILVAMTSTIAILVVLVLLIVPVFVSQVADLADKLPTFIEDAQARYDTESARHSWLPKIDWETVTEGDVKGFAIDQAATLTRNIFPFLSGVGGAITSAVFTFFITLFFVTEPGNYLEGMLTLFPRSYRPRALEILEQLATMLQRWFIGQLISMVMSGTLIALTTGLVLRLPNAPALGVISGLMEFVPNFGSIIAVVPAVIIALAKDPLLVPITILAYLVVQQVQSNIIMPRIMSRQISIPAATILVAQIIGAALFGFMGVLLALPLAIVVMVFVREIYVHDVLNARTAQIETHTRADGSLFRTVTTEVYRPEALSPGAAALVRAEGRDLFTTENGQVVEIITPPSPALESVARGQQAVWLAILTLTVAQGLALLRSVLDRE